MEMPNPCLHDPTTTVKENDISIEVLSLNDLLGAISGPIFKIPDYQRPYVWDKTKIHALFRDVADFYDGTGKESSETHYYMGTILFHHDSGKLSIIDGQQRLTTLLLIDYLINGQLSLLRRRAARFELVYNSPVSIANIRENKLFIQGLLERQFGGYDFSDLMEKIIVTVIITGSADDAFTFFDSQNNRGVSLSAVDFLKSYHLKSIKGEIQDELKQAEIAKVWDADNADEFLKKLFDRYIWRVRKWRGNDVYFENKDEILKEFQKATKDKNSQGIPLYPTKRNRIAQYMSYNVGSGLEMIPQTLSSQMSPGDYPFTLRQPLEKGTGFFLFTQKYSALYRQVFKKGHDSGSELYLVNEFYDLVYQKSGLSHYLTDFFKMCVLFHYDKFGQESLYAFALWLDYLIGSYRIRQKSIVAQTTVKIVRDNNRNLLDVIDAAYLPEEVTEFLRMITDNDHYVNEITGNGVQGAYKQALLSYFDKNGEAGILTEKKLWIDDRLK